MESKGKHKPPTAGMGDKGHAVIRAGLGAIPVLGSAATELFIELVTPPLERRRMEWMEEVGKALERMENEKQINLEELQANEGFVDVVIQATRIAMRNNQEEKRQALLNAVINSALPDPPKESLRYIFLLLIEEFTVWHVRILKVFNDPISWAENNGVQFPSLFAGGLSDVLEKLYPELAGQRSFYDLIWKDLSMRSLVTTDSLHVTMSGKGLMERRTSETGKQFIEFMESPFEGS